MDLSLTWRGDYVMRAALALAAGRGDGGWLKAAEIAERMEIPRTYVAQILAILVHKGLVDARAGPQGGYRLARDPSHVSLLAVVEAGEGELVSGRCVLRGSPCGRRGTCAIHDHWDRARQALRAELEATSLRDVVASAEGMARPPRRRRQAR